MNINSIEDIDKIKEVLSGKINELCESDNLGLILQSSDIIKNIQNFSIEMKKENKELQYFSKKNGRDNLIDVYKDNKFQKMYFDQYNREDLLKIAKIMLDKCERQKCYDENLNFICEILSDYKHYKNLDEEDKQGIEIILKSIKECEKKSKLEHYNLIKS